WKLENDFRPMRLIISTALGISLTFAARIWSERIGHRLLLSAIAVLVVIGYYFLLPVTEKEFGDSYVFILIPSFILSHLLVAIAPYLKKHPEMGFWQYNKNLFVNFVLTVIFTQVLTGGM